MGILDGKIAIVTGSGANIGEACARKLAAEGAKVALADINLAGAERVVASIRNAGGEARAFALDLAQEDSIKALIAAVVAEYGRIDVLHTTLPTPPSRR